MTPPRVSVVAAAAFGLAAGWMISVPPVDRVAAQTSAPAVKTVWEYSSKPVELRDLQQELTALGEAGWEVFAITPTIQRSKGAASSQGAGNGLIAEIVEVTAKRSKAK